MDQSLTPTLHLAGTGSEILNRNFRRIDDAFAAKAAAQPLPKSPIDPLGSSPTIGLAYTNDPNLNHNLRLTDALFSATPPTHHGFHGLSNATLNLNFAKVIAAFYAAAVTPPPPELEEDAEEKAVEEKADKKGWW